MDDEQPQTPPAPATPPAPTETPAPPTPPPAEPPKPERDKFFDQLLKDVGKVITPEGKVENTPPAVLDKPVVSEKATTLSQYAREKADRDKLKPPVDPNTPPAEKPADPAAPATPPEKPAAPPKAIVKPRKDLSDVVKSEVEKALAQNQPAQPPPMPPPPKQEAPKVDEYEAGLAPAQRKELDLARFAAEAMPEKYGNLAAEMVKYYKKLDDYVAKNQDGDRTFDTNDSEFVKWIRENKPKYDDDKEELIERRLTQKAEKSVEEKHRAKIAEQDAKLYAMEMRPKVESAVREVAQNVHRFIAEEGGESLAAEIVAKAQNEGWDKVEKEDPFHAPIVREELIKASILANDYQLLKTGLQQYDGRNPRHDAVWKFVVGLENEISARPDKGKRIGPSGQTQTFLPAVEMAKLPPHQAANYWTLSDNDIMHAVARKSAASVGDRLKKEQERLAAAGYTRAPKQGLPPPPNSAPPPTPVTPPKAPVSISPGAGVPGNVPKPAGLMNDDEVNLLLGRAKV